MLVALENEACRTYGGSEADDRRDLSTASLLSSSNKVVALSMVRPH